MATDLQIEEEFAQRKMDKNLFERIWAFTDPADKPPPPGPREGKVAGALPPETYRHFALLPDGSRLAAFRSGGGRPDRVYVASRLNLDAAHFVRRPAGFVFPFAIREN